MNGKIMLNGKAYSSSGRPSKEITYAQWLALPDTKYTDGIVYYIKDVGGANQFPPLIYSDEEREIGVWRDGKPLYQKTLTVTITNKVQWIETNIDTDSLIVDTKGVLVTPNLTNGIIILPSGDPVGLVGIGTIFKDVISTGTFSLLYRADSNSLGSGTAYITIWYTKGSDVAGSGTWTTDGTYAKHYSTEEKVIGTWVDGKPLYEKTFNFGALPNNTTKDVNHNIPNIDHIWIVGGFAEASATGFTNQLSLSGTSGGDWYFGVNKTYIRCLANSNRTGYDICYVTVNYTKTTD